MSEQLVGYPHHLNVTFAAGVYVVRELHTIACRACHIAWQQNPRRRRQCDHATGTWAVGTIGPRGGWYEIKKYRSERAARHVAQAMHVADSFPPQGRE